MTRRFCTLLAAFFLAACSLNAAPVAPDATPRPAATAQPAAEPGDQATPAPSAPDRPTAAPAAAQSLDNPAEVLAAAPGERDQAALVEAFKQTGPLPEVARTEPLDVQVGDVETFIVNDSISNSNYEIEAKLRYAGPVALMYVDARIEGKVRQEDIERSAREFEERIYPRNRALFGAERSPGIDGDPRLTILSTDLRGAGGYFSSADAVLKQVNRFSNEREMFIIGVNSFPLGTDAYASTLAHEFQHMIHWAVVRGSATWFNEGLSTIAEDLNGYYEDASVLVHLANPDIQLNAWASNSAQTGAHYGTSRLFLRYFLEQYGDEDTPAELIEANAGNRLDAFVPIAQRARPEVSSFAEIVTDWAVANLINNPSVDGGRYAYELLPETVEPEQQRRGTSSGDVSQFGADYLELPAGATVQFDGDEIASIAGVAPQSGQRAWWSNRGDDSVQTLTRRFDLSGVEQATLNFSTWYEIELDYDYGFASVSTDGGETWTTLEGQSTTNDDPQGANFGNGFTGVSGAPGEEPDTGVDGQWIEEQMDLTPFAGQQVLVRFWMVHDAAVNSSGMMIDNIRIPEIGYSYGAEDSDDGWESVGFVRTSGALPQLWSLRLVRSSGAGLAVESVPVDEQGRAEVRLAEGERGVLVVVGATPVTTEKASYQLTIS